MQSVRASSTPILAPVSSRVLQAQQESRLLWSRAPEATMLVGVLTCRRDLSLNCGAAIVTPDDMAAEKLHALRSLGADVEQVRPASIVDKKQVGSAA